RLGDRRGAREEQGSGAREAPGRRRVPAGVRREGARPARARRAPLTAERDRAFARLAIERGLVAHGAISERLRALPAGTALRDDLVARGLLRPEQASELESALGKTPSQRVDPAPAGLPKPGEEVDGYRIISIIG